MSARLQNRSGFALIASLWLIVAISSIALFLGARARTTRIAAATTVERTRAEAAAFGGLEQTRARLQAELDANRNQSQVRAWTRLARVMPDTMDLAQARYTVDLHDVGSRLNLNRATEEELKRLMRALRIDFGDADRLAQRIADWRDSDDLERGRGAERDTYVKLNAMELPANRPFGSVSELRFVLGMTESLMQKLEPVLTVDGSGLVNVNAASEAVLLALPGITPEAARAIARMQTSREGVRSLDDVASSLSEGAREAMRRAMPALMTRTTTSTTEIVALATGWTEGSPIRVVARGLFARGGTHVFFVQRNVL